MGYKSSNFNSSEFSKLPAKKNRSVEKIADNRWKNPDAQNRLRSGFR
jgi:hypothetical protein